MAEIPAWVILATASAIFYGIGNTAMFYITQKKGLNPTAVSSAQHGLGTIFSLMPLFITFPYSLSKNFSTDIMKLLTSGLILYPIIIAIFMFTADAALYMSYDKAPNPAYAGGISNLYIILTVLLPFFIFKSKISVKKVFGMMLSLFSAYLLIK